MSLKINLDSKPSSPYFHPPISPMRRYNMSFDNCFSPQAKSQTLVHSPQHNNVAHPYYMPEHWFSVAPPMAIDVEEEKEEEKETKSISELSMAVTLLIANFVRDNKDKDRRKKIGPVESSSFTPPNDW
ncbi:conserved hypothetical protein [Ricinus communis]|uniref:Uncharacterized protein n=1 Tax=Ricinus communis TaxID=3988 RepID=B9SRH8_RICCO|nr:conserved hypothetical protein [Ricinus communis]